jgi:aminoglycoside 2'-N-acetyltransferase I
MKIEFVATDQLSEIQKEGLKQLRTAVYPAAALATLIGKQVTWAPPQWSILVWDEEDELVSRVGLVMREIVSNGEPKIIGGIGGAMTDPKRQDKGYASEAIREAVRIFREEWKVAYALLFCGSRLIEFYKRLLWAPFEGQIFVEQPKGRIEFTANTAMVLDVKEPAPLSGSLDLNGLPW